MGKDSTALLWMARKAFLGNVPFPVVLLDTGLEFDEVYAFRDRIARHLRTGIGELYRDVVRRAYVAALQRYVPELTLEDTLPGPSGVRAQAMRPDGSLVDDFVFSGSDRTLHVRNAPSPGATSSLAIARYIADEAHRRFTR